MHFDHGDFLTIVSPNHCYSRAYCMMLYARHNLRAYQKKNQLIWLVRCNDIAQITHFLELR